MTKRWHEEVARSSFSAWLASNDLADKSVWLEVEQKDEPPDWYLDIGPARYAIEATSVVDCLRDFDPPLPGYSISLSLHHFIERLEKEAKLRGPLNGAYLVSLAPIPNLKEHEQWLFDELTGYIDRTRDKASAEEYELGKIKFHTLSIVKFESESEYVTEAISFGAKSGGQAFEDLQRLLTHILDNKSSLLKEIDFPIILLLHDAYHYSHIVDWINVISELSVPCIFESLFRTVAEETAQLVFTQNQWWEST